MQRKKLAWSGMDAYLKERAIAQYRAIRSAEEEIPESDVDIGGMPFCNGFYLVEAQDGTRDIEVDI